MTQPVPFLTAPDILFGRGQARKAVGRIVAFGRGLPDLVVPGADDKARARAAARSCLMTTNPAPREPAVLARIMAGAA